MNPNTPERHEIVLAHAEERLFPQRSESMDDTDLAKVYHQFIKEEKAKIRQAHKNGASGLDIASRRSAMVDVVIRDFYEITERRDGPQPFTLIASGGYGRGLLNPGSDIDLQFLLHSNKDIKERITPLLTFLYDAGFDVGHGTRTIKEATRFANQDHPTKTALLDARLITGDKAKFEVFENAFFKECIKGKEKKYLEDRSHEIRKRHRKYGRTVHRQEPQVKLGCGGLRDYHNLIWMIWVLQKSRDLHSLVKSGQLSEIAYTAIEEAYQFLMLVRNELHFIQKGKQGDIMTLRLQGIIATNLKYPGSTIIKRSEQFMREYYGHTRALYQHGTSLMQAFELDVEDSILSPVPIVGALAARFHPKKRAKFDGFVSKDGLVFADGDDDPFKEDTKRLMRFFLHTQQRGLHTSPEIRKLFKLHWDDIDAPFQQCRINKEVFEQILQSRGQVAQVLRQMHRVGFLGRYIPEFGVLTDLVQHEFFHQYSADEHTLRCIDELDRVHRSDEPKEQFFKEVIRDIDDPVALYVALIMHDTGRAEGVEVHEDASAVLAAQVCRRLNFRGDRLRLILFLVDHHLTFWRTATTKDISDRETIANFAAAMKNRSNMEALFLFTYVDSRGTNDEAWNDWKASLMEQLFRSTCAYFEDRKKFDEKFQRPITLTKQKVDERLDETYQEEIEAHFRTMPERYFNYRGSSSIVRHIKLFRRFFEQISNNNRDNLIPAIVWNSRNAEGYTLMELAGWNRHQLLANIAGALASNNLNILSADIYMREDDLVLDVFRICTTNFSPINQKEIEKIEALIFEACKPVELLEPGMKPIDFKALIEANSKPTILDEPAPLISMPQRAYLNNDLTSKYTVLEIQAIDRIGLLHDIFQVLSDLDIAILNARISTQAGAAIDRLYLVDIHTEEKIVDSARLTIIQERVWQCLAESEDDQKEIPTETELS